MGANSVTAGRAGGAREFAIDTGVVAAAQLLLKLRGLVAIPLIVKMLGTAEYGVWAQTLAFIDFSASLLGGNFYHPLVRFLAEKPEEGRSVYSTLMTATVVAGVAGGLVIYLGAEGLSRYVLNDAGYEWYIKVGALLVLCYNVRLINLNAYRATGRLKERAALELASTFGQLVGVGLLLWQGHDLLRVFLFMAAWEAAFAVLMSWHVSTFVGWGRLDKKIFLDAARYALPLLPAGLSIWMLDRGDRLVIGHYMGAREVGVYSASYALAGLLMFVQTPLQMTLLPKVASLWEQDRAGAVRYVSLSNKLFLTLAVPFVVGVPFVAGGFLSRLGNEEIGAAAGPLTLLISAGVMLWGVSVMQTQIFYGARRTLPVGAVTVGGALLNLALCLLLVPRSGALGAAFATLVSYAAVCVAFYWLGRHLARIDFYATHLLKCAAAALLMAAVLRALTLAWPGATAAAIVAGAATYFLMLGALGAATPAEVALLKGLFRLPARS